MPFKKGVSGCPGGRTDPRKARSREAIARVVEGSADKIAGWIEAIERDEGPKAALDAFIRLAEYALPKLARVEAVGDNGGPVETVQRIELVAASFTDAELDAQIANAAARMGYTKPATGPMQ